MPPRYLKPLWACLLTAHLALGTAATGSQGDAHYDYIVVGSGPGGGTVASGLARANFTVLLIEAGDDSREGNMGDYSPGLTWDFFVRHYDDEQKNRMNNKLTWMTPAGRYWVGNSTEVPPAGSTFLGIYYPRGAALGGSSLINAMATQLPADSDWDYVANITGDASWRSEAMRDVFEKIEHNNYLPPGTPGHGFDGFFQTTMFPTSDIEAGAKSVGEAVARSLDLDPANLLQYANADPNALDPNRDTTEGIFGSVFHMFPNTTRFSSRVYIQDTIRAGFPLTLAMNSLATRVVWEDAAANNCSNTCKKSCQPRAVGVDYLEGTALYRADRRATAGNTGVPRRVFAKREVILSGGVFNSPQLLKLSGVGPAAELSQFNISVVVDAPGVGTNLMDNQEMPVVGRLAPTAPPADPNAYLGIAPGAVMLRTPHAPTEERDVYVMHGQVALRGFWPTDQDNTLPLDPPGTYGMSIVKQFPQNRAGTVRLKSADPRDTPDINLRLYAQGNATDLGAMRDVVAWARRVYADVAAPYGPVAPVEPPCVIGQVDADGYCVGSTEDEDWIIGQTFGHHGTGTCKIGGDTDPTAVLDSHFRVRGARGLRVVDASTFPRTPGVYPVVATFMIGQKAVDTILAGRTATDDRKC